MYLNPFIDMITFA